MYHFPDNFPTCKQGILVPVETQVKHNTLGLGAEKPNIQRRKKTEMSQATISQNSEKVSDVALDFTLLPSLQFVLALLIAWSFSIS